MNIIQFSDSDSFKDIIVNFSHSEHKNLSQEERVDSCTLQFSVNEDFKERLKQNSSGDDNIFMDNVKAAFINHVIENELIRDCFGFVGGGSEINSIAAVESMELFEEKLKEKYPQISIVKFSLDVHYQDGQVYTYQASRDANGQPTRNAPVIK